MKLIPCMRVPPSQPKYLLKAPLSNIITQVFRISTWELFRNTKIKTTSHGNSYCICCSVAKLCLTPCDHRDCSTPAFPVLHYLPEFAQTHVHGVDDAIRPSSLPLPPSPSALSHSQDRGLFQWVSSSHQVANYWRFSFSISPSNEYSGFISFRIDWFDLLIIQRTVKSLLQHHSSKASILQCGSLHCGPTLTSIHDYWKSPSLDYTDLCRQSDIFAF